ncbi:MAG TPA: gamma-glutamyltransferase [Nitrosopumilaceae archaeon]|jgi:gamma-glutamyltranspeptidase/glutathione hydrolase|nr:gamma-glutamyltransferase [Nitrosopumilaceae archaeon]
MFNLEKIENSFQTTIDNKFSESSKGMVSSAFPNASKAGAEILKKGGNAIDAACAVSLALGVCEPQASGIGGQSMGIIHFEGKTICIDGSTRAPSLATPSRFKNIIERSLGYRATTVPSTVAVMGILNERYGNLEWAKILKPAIRIAKKGYRITKLQHDLQQKELENFTKLESRSGAKYFLKDGTTPFEPKDLFIQDELAELLSYLADNGYKSFYHGKIPKIIDADMRKNKGLLREDDLVMIPKIIEREPIVGKYRNVTVKTFPPPAVGRILLLILMLLNQLPPKVIKNKKLEFYHYLVETFKRSLAFRTQRPYDVATYKQFDDKLLFDKTFLKHLSESIIDGIQLNSNPKMKFHDEDTTHLSVMDDEGNAVGITQSIELVYGSNAAAEGLGFLYNSYMASFEYDNINYPHYLRPNTSPWTSVAPTILFHKNKPWMTLGTPGSDRIPTITAQFISSMIDSGLSPNDAMNKPRIHCTVDGIVAIEGERFDASIIPYLAELGYKIESKEPYSYYHGAIHAVIKKNSSKGFQGMAEIRRDGTAVGVD